MSGDKRGGNLGALHDLATMFSRHSKNLDQIIRDLNGKTVSSQNDWWGPGADRFRQAWQEAKSAFDKMAHALEEGGQDVKKSAQNIERATS